MRSADPHQIEQVVMNLVVNARDAMPGGGELTIEISSVDLGASASNRPADAPPGHYILLSVIDNGVGMDEATRSHIFEPFFTLKETGKGTGLGLSTAQGIVAQSGGFIEVQSEIGRGSAFRVFLPRADAPVAQPCEVRSVMDLGGRETVLLVEDQPEVLRFAAQALAEFGYRTLSAGGPEEALATFRRERGRIDLVVTDVVMPGMSGPRLAGALEELCPNVKVLFISGFTGDEIARHGVMDEGVRFLAKPFTPEQLAAKVRAALDAQNS
ncbi:MAG: response regulator [Acidobacteria bacterium]|nr:response regulator [Acidobacteriota bacterium]